MAYTVGAGKAVISTPYWYAEEMLADERGVLVPFRDPPALAAQVIDLLDNEAKRHAMRKRAYMFGRDMIWPQVARRYLESFARARAEQRTLHAARISRSKPLDKRPAELPPLKLDHLRHMTDDTGMLQHAIFTVPNYREGYTVDDNARALMVSVLVGRTGPYRRRRASCRAILLSSVMPSTTRPDAFATLWITSATGWRRAVQTTATAAPCGLWAPLLGRSNTPGLQSMAGWLFEQALPAILETTSPRAWAFALIGIHEYLRRYDGDRRASQVREELAGRLLHVVPSESFERMALV